MGDTCRNFGVEPKEFIDNGIRYRKVDGGHIQCSIPGCRSAQVVVLGNEFDVCLLHAESGLTASSTQDDVVNARRRRQRLSEKVNGNRHAPRPGRPNSRRRRELKARGIHWRDVVSR